MTSPPNQLFYRSEIDDALWQAPPRKFFVDALNHAAPEVVERLLELVHSRFPAPDELSSQLERGPRFSRSAAYGSQASEEHGPLEQVIEEWAAGINLGYRLWSRGRWWLHACAFYTVSICVGLAEPPTGGAATVQLPQSVGVSMTLEEGAVVLKFREYDPYVHDYGRYLVARTKEFSASMERYLDRLAKETSRTGMVEGYRGNKLEHYEWVVCFQVRNQSYEEIADHYGEKHRGSLDAHHVGAAIQKASKAIGLRTRARPGRPARR